MAIETTYELMDLFLSETGLSRFLESGSFVPGSSGQLHVGWGDVRRSAQPVAGRLSVYAPDFQLQDPRPWHVFGESCSTSAEALGRALEGFDRAPTAIDWEQPSFAEFEASFQDIQRRIASGELAKAVPSIVRQAFIEVDSGLKAHALRRVLELSRRSLLQPYGLWSSDDGIIGATPELLFEQRSGRNLETMALAGTRPAFGDRASLLTDDKERFEHRIVVDGIVEQLSPFGPVTVDEVREIRLPTLVHLETGIRVHTEPDVSFGEWVEALHPTPAIGAWPRVAGWEWLTSQSNAESRKRYGAPFGVIGPGEEIGRCYVAIRNLQWDSERAWITGGGGIVSASRLDREWVEFNSKLDSVQEALGI